MTSTKQLKKQCSDSASVVWFPEEKQIHNQVWFRRLGCHDNWLRSECFLEAVKPELLTRQCEWIPFRHHQTQLSDTRKENAIAFLLFFWHLCYGRNSSHWELSFFCRASDRSPGNTRQKFTKSALAGVLRTLRTRKTNLQTNSASDCRFVIPD